jgi:hypothetical protein
MPLQTIIANASGVSRRETMAGKDYLVVPMIILTEGVHGGSGGALYYPPEELRKTPVIWNHKPIVVYHPERGGAPVSACDPEVISNRGIGMMMNTEYKRSKGPDGKMIGKVHSEAWLDPDRVEQVDIRILEAIESDEMMELSTGLFTDNERIKGNWNGEEYKSIARNYRPDHLAILPDQVGACSLADGAGLLRVNVSIHSAESQEAISKALFALNMTSSFNTNEKSFSTITSELWTLLGTIEKDAYIVDVFDDFFIYSKNNLLFMMGYEEDGDTALVGSPAEIKRVTEYRTADGTILGNAAITTITNEEKNMGKQELVDGLIANAAVAFEEADRTMLMGFDEAKLAKFSIAPVAPAAGASDPAAIANAVAEGAAGVAPVAAITQPAAVVEKQLTDEEYIAKAPPGIRESLQSLKAQNDAAKTAVCERILANTQNTFTKEYLASRKLEELNGIAALMHEPKVAPTANYRGQAGAPPTTNGKKQVALTLPKSEVVVQ